MCGICGVFGLGRSPAPVDPSRLDRMTDAMRHRGPDDRGVFIDSSLGLGMRRLSIIDLACGRQPMHGEDKRVWVVFNGEIYNFAELRSQLVNSGHRFATAADTEVIVHGYEEWGSGVLGRLNGMFGLAIWDSRARALTLARDAYGVKPLYYTVSADEFAFASEIRPLLLGGRRAEVNRRALPEYLRYGYVPSPQTMFEGIMRLRPGHALRIDGERAVESRFAWSGGDVDPPRQEGGSQALVGELRRLVSEAVRRQLVADVPVGVLLSGGVDSTALAGIVRQESDVPLDVFTVGFGRDFRSDEVGYASETARRLGLPHHHIDLSAARFTELLPECVASLEEPVATTSTVAYRAVCGLAAEHVKVVLTGQGADEPFGGYPRYRGLGLYERLPRRSARLMARALGPALEHLPRSERLKRGARLLATDGPEQALASMYSTVRESDLLALLHETAPDTTLPPALTYWRDAADGLPDALLDKAMRLDARTVLPDNLLLYGDKLSMAVSLEARVPFLDLPLMAAAERVPASVKMAGGIPKALWKDVLSPWVPPSVTRRRKIGFQTPVDEWFRQDEGLGLRERLLDADSGCREHFDAREVARIITEHERGTVDHKRLLFALLVFELWHGEYVRGRHN
jgi:asparagine synthase (glutamine-hydrolysing)